MKKLAILALVASLAGCGASSAPARGPEEVTASWTSGDDAPLETAPAASPKRAHGAQPGRPKT